ncbi:MAG: gliding motility lipoprotein GldH [bacterium]|nr:gliding motility lipoprotein GldH [bacterium]
MYLTACTDKAIVVDEMRDIPKASWAFNQIPDFDFDIKNTQLNHNLYLNLKIQKTYPYENLYLLTHIKDTEGNIVTRRVNFNLMDENGNPNGSMSGNSISYQLPIFTNQKFNKTGKYFIALEQNMRDSVINGVESIGVMIKEGQPVF